MATETADEPPRQVTLPADERERILNAASDLAGSMDYVETMEHLADLLVPRLADVMVVDILAESGELRRGYHRHADPARQPILEELARRFPPTGEAAASAPAEAIRTGRPVVIPEVTERELTRRILDPDHRRLLRRLETRSTLSVPLKARGRTIGALTLATGPSRRRLDAVEAELTIEVARRASLAIDNARLWEEARRELQRSERAIAELDLERRRLRTVLDLLPVGVWVADQAGRLIASNPAARTIWGGDAPASEHTGRYHEDYPAWWPDGRPVGRSEWGLARAIERGQTSGPDEVRIQPRNGEPRWILNYGMPIRDGRGQVAGGVALSVDITERKRLEERQRFLAETSRILAESLDPREALERLARHAVGGVADYAIAYLVGPDGGLSRSGAAHVDPDRDALVRRLEETEPVHETSPIRRQVIERGETVFAPSITDEMLRANARGPEHLELLRQLQPCSVIIVPLRTRGRTVAGLAVSTVEGGRRPYTDEDVALVEELAARAALAVDNAQLFRAAQGASEAKSQFLAVMSHELRTPLSAIIGFTDLLAQGVWGPLTERQQEQVGRIRGGAWHLVSIIDQILTFSRAEAGREQVEVHPTDLGALVVEAVSLVEPEALAKGLRLEMDVAAPGRVVKTDAGKVRQIVLNLLGNAIKFTDAGSVRVGLGVQEGFVVLEIVDTGPGIPPEDHERMFEPFTQLDQSSTRTKGGAGLGLPVSRKLARLLGGDIVVQSAPGGGSGFRLLLPDDGGSEGA